MDFSQLSDTEILKEYSEQVERRIEVLALKDKEPSDENMGQLEGVQQIMGELSNELKKRGFHINRKFDWQKGEACELCAGLGGWDDLDNNFYECWHCDGTGIY